MYTLYWSPDTGAFAVQAVLEELGLPYERIVVSTKEGAHRRPEYLALNPMGQVPTLRLPDGTLLTESAAMVMHLCDTRPEAGLLPAPGTPERARAYRWLMLMVVLYEADLRCYYPERYTSSAAPDEAAGVREAALGQMERLYAILDRALDDPGPYLMGERLSACDLFLFMLTLWHPERQAFLAQMPGLHRLAREVRRRPAVDRIWAQHFPAGGDGAWSTWTG